jgi:ethanolamine utilization protein EutQ (cupin superfamily)
MPKLIEKPVLFHDTAVKGDEIKEFVGRICTQTAGISIGLLTFPEGWSEPPQRPEFDEYSVILEGSLYVDTESAGTVIVRAGQGILTPHGERIQYRTPEQGGAKYIAVCLPAFASELTHREPVGIELPKTPPNGNPQGGITLCCRPSYFHGTGARMMLVEEFFGVLNGNSATLSIARVQSQEGYKENFRRVDYDNYYIVLSGELHLQEEDSGEWIKAGTDQAIFVPRGESTRRTISLPEGSEYMSISLPPWDQDFDRDEILTDINRIFVMV